MRIFIYTLAAAAVVIGGWLLWINGPNSPYLGEELGNIIKIEKNGDIKGQYALKDIIAIDEPYKCEFEKKDQDSKVKGKIFIAPGAKVRGNFNVTSTATAAPFESYFIMIGGFAYSWTSLLNVGFRSPIGKNASSTPEDSLMSVSEKIKYDCSRWDADRSKFEIPADIIFKNVEK